MIVRARAPLRLGLAGGGTDVSPYCDLHGGYVLNATIDMYAHATIEPYHAGKVCFTASDQEVTWEGRANQLLEFDGKLDLHIGVYNRIVQQFNGGRPLSLKLTTHCDAPPGSGLGSSSTLVVAMLKAYQEMLNLPFGDYELAHLAYEIERLDVKLAGGKQDQYAAAFGGFNFIEFYDGGRVLVNPLRVKNWIISELESSLVLFYTGVSRSSAAIIDNQARNVSEGRHGAIDAFHALKEEALHMKEGLLKGDFDIFVSSMRRSWDSKKQTALGISNVNIENIYESAMAAGARAGKVSGAGGGGFMMLFVDPSRRPEVVRSLQRFPGQVFNCHFVKTGSQGWKI